MLHEEKSNRSHDRLDENQRDGYRIADSGIDPPQGEEVSGAGMPRAIQGRETDGDRRLYGREAFCGAPGHGEMFRGHCGEERVNHPATTRTRDARVLRPPPGDESRAYLISINFFVATNLSVERRYRYTPLAWPLPSNLTV